MERYRVSDTACKYGLLLVADIYQRTGIKWNAVLLHTDGVALLERPIAVPARKNGHLRSTHELFCGAQGIFRICKHGCFRRVLAFVVIDDDAICIPCTDFHG